MARTLYAEWLSEIKLGDHLCVFYIGADGRDDALLPYVCTGLRAGHKCLFSTNDADTTRIMDGILHRDVKKAVACRQLEIRVADDRVVSPATFSVPRVIDFWDGGVTAVLDEGYGFVRFGAEARWWMPQMLDIDAFMRYESELNRYIPTRSQSALCLYDLNHFGGDVVINAMKVHPRVVIDGLMVENPYYLDPDDYREDLATRS